MGFDVEARVFLFYVAAMIIVFLLGKPLLRLFINGVIGAAFVAVFIELLERVL